jgi:hypothetical protein
MKNLWYIAVFALIFASCETEISEFQTQNFVKYFGGGSSANGFDVQEISDGYILTGFDYTTELKKQIFVVRTNTAGNVVWQRRYGTVLNEEGKVIKAFGDSYYIVGTTTNENGTINSFMLKLNENGDSIGYQVFGTDSHSLIINDFIVDETSVCIAGETFQNSPTQSDYYIAKYLLNGDEVWVGPLTNFSGNQSFKKLFLNNEGRYTATGVNSGVINSTFTHISLSEINNSQGVTIRFKNLDATSNQLFEDALFVDNEIIIAYNQQVQGVNDGRLVKVLHSDFNPVWHLQSGLPFTVKALTHSSNGVFTLCGELSNNIYLSQIDDSGNITLSGQDINEIKTLPGLVEGVLSTSDDGFILVGTTAPDYGTMMQLVKTNAELFLFQP